jgi:hypothetical protein
MRYPFFSSPLPSSFFLRKLPARVKHNLLPVGRNTLPSERNLPPAECNLPSVE